MHSSACSPAITMSSSGPRVNTEKLRWGQLKSIPMPILAGSGRRNTLWPVGPGVEGLTAFNGRCALASATVNPPLDKLLFSNVKPMPNA